MLLRTKDEFGVERRHEVEAQIDEECNLVDLSVPCFIEAHKIVGCWMESAIKSIRIDHECHGGQAVVGGGILLNDPRLHFFYLEYEC